jgi:hypothetical protein
MTIDRAIEILDPEHREHYDGMDEVNEACRMGMEALERGRNAVPVVRCRDCKHLRVWNQKDIYAFCPKTNIVFLPFEKDTRTFFCSFGEAKMNGGIENASKEM